MGTHSLQKLLNILNEILSLEWLIYYKYWMGAQLIKNADEDKLADFIMIQASKELDNAQRISVQITRLGGIPLFDVSSWSKKFEISFYQEGESLTACILENYIQDVNSILLLSNRVIALLAIEDKEIRILIECIISQNMKFSNLLQEKIKNIKITHGS